MVSTPEPLVLASASLARAAMLCAAGVEFAIDPAAIDEAAIKQECRDSGHDALACAMLLAKAKARTVARRHPDSLIIGADQILVAGDEWFEKPTDLTAAAAQLRRLRDREHVLATAACVVQRTDCLWEARSAPKLTMRRFGEAFLAGYIAAEGETLLGSVGAYRLEGRGVQLFAQLEGDYFAILGLPLLALIDFLRSRKLLSE
jgi:nucleoside triphosphate pyrophosphatase